jgi:transposase
MKSKRGDKVYKTVLVRESYRENGEVKHRTLSNITKLPANIVTVIKKALKQESGWDSVPGMEITGMKEFGASKALLSLAAYIGLDKAIYSRHEQWRDNAMAMIVGRVLYQGSKLSLTNLHMDTALWELCGHEPDAPPDVDIDCYQVLDRLLEHQSAIQKRLASKHLKDGCLILYDITSVYMEGEYENSEIVVFGRCKEGKRGHEQIAIGLLADKAGCPVAVEVFKGNTADKTTVLGQAKKLANEFGVSEIVFAGDRGMLPPANIAKINEMEYRTITALTHPQLKSLLERKVVQMDLFDERRVAEVFDPDNPAVRYLLCMNPATRDRERKTRDALVRKTREALDKLAAVKKRRKGSSPLAAKVGVVLAKYKMGKFFNWTARGGRLSYSVDEDKIRTEEALDGCYVIRSDVPKNIMDSDESVRCYKSLATVEMAFRNMKTVALEIRPVHHHKDDRIKAHVLICMLAYYLQWHMVERLKPIFENDGQGAERRWSLPVVIERLKSIRRGARLVDGVRVGFMTSKPDEEQMGILKLLRAEL